MASIDIIIPQGTIHIELLDNPFVKKWTEHFCNMQKAYDIDYHAETQPVYHTTREINDIHKDIANLITSIKKVNNFPFDVEKITYNNLFDNHLEGQKMLNEIHRYFTTAG